MSLQSLSLPIKAVVLKSEVKINARQAEISLRLDQSMGQTTRNTGSYAFHDGMNHNQTLRTIQPLTVSVPLPDYCIHGTTPLLFKYSAPSSGCQFDVVCYVAAPS